MSALAQYHAMRGGTVSGSDRAFDAGQAKKIRGHLEQLGIRIFPQDGSGLTADSRNDSIAAEESAGPVLVVSTAVEDTVADVRAAKELGVPVLHRAELLSRFVNSRRTIAVTGTSGKSTVAAMIFELLRGAGRAPSVITGGELLLLQEEGLLGNAWADEGDLLVIEADESDGSLTRYTPWMGVVLNLQRDHKEPEELAALFHTFRRQTTGPFILGEDENLNPFAVSPVVRAGLGSGCDLRAEEPSMTPDGSSFLVHGVRFRLPVPGMHNIANAVAAIAACLSAGVPLSELTEPLRRFRGVARRFQSLGRVAGVEVVDDFAHNPSKIAASLATARPRARRILAFFQPHGFGPTRFLRDGLIDALATNLTPDDRLYMPEIFYAGGTAVRNISSREIADAVALLGIPTLFAERREELLPSLIRDARAVDLILVMGARDPSLSAFCRRIVYELSVRSGLRPVGKEGGDP